MTNKYCVWMITGGTTHALCCLSACMKYAVRSNRIILPFSETHSNFGSKFYDFYSINKKAILSRYFVGEDDYEEIKRRYKPPYIQMPAQLSRTCIDGPEPDSYGNQRYFLRDLYRAGTNERYLDYPAIDGEKTEYVVTWGRHDNYWSNQLKVVMNTLLPSEDMRIIIQRYRKDIVSKIRNMRYLSVHFRNSDYKSDYKNIMEAVRLKAKDKGYQKVYWASDDIDSAYRARKELNEYGIEVIHTENTINYKQHKSKNLHSIKKEDLEKMGSNKYDMIGAFYADVITLSQGEELINGKGTVPFLIRSIKGSAFEKAITTH